MADGCARDRVGDLTRYTVEQASDVLLQNPADVFGFTVYCTKWAIVKELLVRLRRALGPAPLIVAGGPNPTAMPQETLASEGVNIVVRGEGEKAFCRIVRDYVRSPSLFVRHRVFCGERLRSNEFPVLDRSFVEPPEAYSRRCFGHPVVTLEASRGCENSCIFCNSVIMGGGSQGGVVCKTPAKILQEIESSQRAGYHVFRFNDDSFAEAAYRNGLLSMMAGRGITYRAFADPLHLREDVLQALKQSGCFHLSVGIESYNPDNLRWIGKRTTQADIRRSIRRAHELGILVRAYFLLGLPFDTDQTVKRFMRHVIDEVPFDEYTLYPLIPYPGTRLWEQPERFGYTILEREVDKYVQIGKNSRTAILLRHKNFSEANIRDWLQWTEDFFGQVGKVQTLYSQVL